MTHANKEKIVVAGACLAFVAAGCSNLPAPVKTLICTISTVVILKRIEKFL